MFLSNCHYSLIGTALLDYAGEDAWGGNLVSCNEAFLGGAGICLSFCSSVELKGNLVVNNSSAEGGGILTLSSSGILLENNSVASNSAQ